MFYKVVIGLLSVCLCAVIGLFLYSEYGTKQTPSEIVLESQPASPATNESSSTASVDATETNSTSEVSQPDKSLPIPAHKLKKLIDDPSLVNDDDLQKKIDAANKLIAEIEEQLASSSDTTPSSDTSVNVDKDTQARLDNIREHLEKLKDKSDK